MIVVTLLESGLAGLRTAISEYDDVADAFEVRLDAMSEPVAPDAVRALTDKPLLAACRRPDDGGTWRGDEAERRQRLAACLAAGFDYVDVEPDAQMDAAEDRLIRSHHDFDATPPSDELVHRMRSLATGGAVAKSASRVRDFGDTLQILCACRQLQRDGVAYAAMGLGDFPRPLLPLFGARFVYGGGRRNAPGQPNARAIAARLRHWGDPGPAGDLYLVVGSPIAHSLSPRIHNAAFRAHEVDASYAAIEIDGARDLGRLLRSAGRLGLRGLSVTAPLKPAAYRLADATTPEADAAGTANTLRIEDGDKVTAHNTDGLGARDVLESRFDPLGRDTRIMILGAGGAASGLLASLRDRNVSVAARREAARGEIEQAFGVQTLTMDEAAKRLSAFDLVVNATSVQDPVPLGAYRGGLFDLHYGAEPTVWHRHAETHNAPFAGGFDLLVAQGRRAFAFWTGMEPDEATMRQGVEVSA